MGMKALISGAVLAALASGATAQTLDPVRVEMFRSILKGNECTLTEGAAANILPRFDFTRNETRAIVGALVAAGEVQLDGNTLMLVDGSCGTGDPVADLLAQRNVQQFIAVMAENGCAMNEADAEPVFAARGLNKAQVGEVVGPMIRAGMASFGAGVLRVDAAYCSAPVVAQVLPPASPTPELDRSGMFGMSRVRALVDVMAANSCTLNMETPDAFLAAANIEHSFATFVARKMVSDGFASMVDEQTMLLPAPYCVSANSPAPQEAPVEPGVDMDMVAALREIFLANSCRLTESQMDALLPPAGFTKDNIKPVFGYLEANGEMGEDGPDLVFYSDACAGAPAEVATASAQTPEMDRSGMFGMSRVAALVDLMAQNGCRLNMEVADGYLVEAGIEHSFATFIATKMISDGFASMADAQNMVLAAPYCIAAGGAAPVVAAENEPSDGETVARVEMAVIPGMSELSMKVILVFNSIGCTLPVTSANDVFTQLGLSTEDSLAGMEPLVSNGQITVSASGGEFILDPSICDPSNSVLPEAAETGAPEAEAVEPAAPMMAVNDGTPLGAFISVAAQNNCTMDVSAAAGLLAAVDLRMDQAYRIVDDLVANGQASLSSGGALVTLDSRICGGAAQPVEQEPAPATSGATSPVQTTADSTDSRAGLLAMLAANGCTVTQANAAGLVAAAGLDVNTSMQILTQMMASGEATSPDGGQTLHVGAPLCVAAGVVPMAPRDTFISLIKQNNCSITAAEFSSLLPVDGLDATTAFGMISELEAEGVITLPATRDVVTLSAEMCR